MIVLEQTPKQLELHLMRNFPLYQAKQHVKFDVDHVNLRFYMTIDDVRFSSVTLTRVEINQLYFKLKNML